jgi:predicted SnoaL-like aldol condensation-catalyzing enzyme
MKGTSMNATISKLREAMNAHDAVRMAALFAPDFRSEQPAHPNRGYVGRDTMAAIWGDLYRAVPDLTSEVVSDVTDGATVWVEWHWRGHHADGSLFEMRGIARTELDDDGLVAAQRLYGEPVEPDGPGILESERQLREPAR